MNCQICGGVPKIIFLKERNVSCGDYFEGRRIYEANLGEISLLECTTCGFGYFGEMHGWPEERYRNEIYNEDYHRCDAPFREKRPGKLAAWLADILQPCDVFDFGGGAGRLAELLVDSGFHARSYDTFYGDATPPYGDADVVSAFEVVEHVPDQRALFRSLKALCRPGGVIVFSTFLKSRQLARDWWYASPRNGHVSFHTADSLERITAEFGLASVSLSPEIHVAAPQPGALAAAAAWRTIPINDIPGFAFVEKWSRMVPTGIN